MSEIKYDRQSRIPKWDQKKISNAKVAVIGAGALGNHVCLGLIGLGVGSIKIFDYDEIETHNLNRQSLFREDDIGQNKAESLAELLKERNSTIEIIGIDEKIEEDTIEDIIRDVDVIIDCVDLIYVRNILNKFCIERDIPLIHGGISWTGGQTGILTRKTPCIKCIYPDALQKEELDTETSCIRNPEASVVYISQIIAGLMVYNV
ncbi:MAG: HesA/MoeB/ThiF family protein, partial [Promethearchaeota archaeon]